MKAAGSDIACTVDTPAWSLVNTPKRVKKKQEQLRLSQNLSRTSHRFMKAEKSLLAAYKTQMNLIKIIFRNLAAVV